MGAYERGEPRSGWGVKKGFSEGRTFRLRLNNKKLRAAGKAIEKAGQMTETVF